MDDLASTGNAAEVEVTFCQLQLYDSTVDDQNGAALARRSWQLV